MIEKGERTLQEILSQPHVWADTLDVFKENVSGLEKFWKQGNFEQVIFIGCGSTHYLSQAAAVIFQKSTGVTSLALPGSEISLFGDIYLPNAKRTLLVAVSRSGETSETVHAMQLFRDGNYGKLMSITTVPGSSVTKYADFSLVAASAQEESIAQTRSFASMMLLAESFALQIAGYDAVDMLAGFPIKVADLFNKYQGLAEELGSDSSVQKFFFLGSAYNYGIANEAMLKMKEMSLSYSEAFHMLEFRHGPKSMVDENSLVVGLVNEKSAIQEIPVLEEMASLNAKILSIIERPNPRLEAIGNVIVLNSGVREYLQTVLFLPILQLLGFYRAISNGQDPDNPHNLEAVVRIPSMTIQ
jgi:glucosamine--fructose-6-phosphate aminotransferase (isomerizing)